MFAKSSSMCQVVIANWAKKQEQMQVSQEKIQQEIEKIFWLPSRLFSEWILKNMEESFVPAYNK